MTTSAISVEDKGDTSTCSAKTVFTHDAVPYTGRVMDTVRRTAMSCACTMGWGPKEHAAHGIVGRPSTAPIGSGTAAWMGWTCVVLIENARGLWKRTSAGPVKRQRAALKQTSRRIATAASAFV